MSALRTLAFIALMAGFCSGRDMDCSYVGLLDHLNLMTHNDTLADVRPVHNWTTPTYVEIDLMILGILEVDEKAQTFTSQTWYTMSWVNEFINWDSADFCGIKKVLVRVEKLWIPDVIIHEDTSDTGSIKMSPFVSLESTGVVFSTSLQRLTSTCQLNLFTFPFDKQSCNITFTSMISTESIALGTQRNDSVLTTFSETVMVTQGEWRLMNINISKYQFGNVNHDVKLVYTVTIRRKPMLYIINLIVPLFFLLLLDLASFFISEARAEKLSFKVTILLSVSVLLLILQDMLPSTEDYLPMMAMFCVTIFLMVGFSLLETMIAGFLLDLDPHCGKEARGSIKANVDMQQEFYHRKEPNSAAGKGEERAENHARTLRLPGDLVLLKGILEEVKRARQEWSSAAGEDEEKKPGWYKRVVKIMDSLYFFFYVICVVSFLLYMNKHWVLEYIMDD